MAKNSFITRSVVRRAFFCLILFGLSLIPVALHAISVGKPAEDTSPEAELKSFTTLDGFEVSLFASEKDGVVNPISIRWDERGRLWVLTTTSYPQPVPGVEPDDKILILEDTDHDGKADKVTVFADHLRMPMGLELAPSATWPEPAHPRSGGLQPPTKSQPRSGKHEASGSAADAEVASTAIGNTPLLAPDRHPMAAYVGEGEKLWIMRDLDGDGKADVREVVFSGFGTGDVHQNINSFTWTPDGALMFSQGLHNYSNVTTPWGGRRLYGAGFWMYRPLRAQLTPYPTGFPLNAWGTVFDDAGQPFSVAGAAGMFWTTPLLVPQYGDEQRGAKDEQHGAGSKEHGEAAASASGSMPHAPSSMHGVYSVHLIERTALPASGQIVKQGMLKYCGVDIPRNAHWPADMHGELVSGGFFENCIYRHKLGPDKANPSGYEAVRQPDLLKSSSVAFRPVDVKFGPDGALYISDWYNPIIGHYQASFRHPDRDKTHGRIWRVVRKGAAHTSEILSAEDTTIRGLVHALDESEWMQYQAQRLLMAKPKDEVFKAIDQAFRASPENVLRNAGYFYPYLWAPLRAREWFESPDAELLREALDIRSEEDSPAIPVKAIGLWQDRLKDPLALLAKSIADEDPRVRLEAIAACAHIPQPQSIAIALRALDKPMDSFLDRTLELTVHSLAPYWEPALRDGKLSLPPKHLAWLLDKKSDGGTLAAVRTLLQKSSIGVAPVLKVMPPASASEAGAASAQSVDPDSRRALLLMLAKRGTDEDVAAALDAGLKDARLLGEFTELVEAQQIKAPANAEKVLGSLCDPSSHENIVTEEVGTAKEGRRTLIFAPNDQGAFMLKGESYEAAQMRLKRDWVLRSTSAFRLIGAWKLSSLTDRLKNRLHAADAAVEPKRAAMIALARLNTEHDLILNLSADTQQPYAVRLGAIEALSLHDGKAAAKAALALMPLAKTEEDMRALLAPFLAKAGSMKPFVAGLTTTPCSKEAADLATRALIAMGRNEPELSAALNKILGRSGVVIPYDAQWVSSLGNEATVSGNAKKGDEIFHRPSLNCIACHSIGGNGGIIGPQLDAVGRGVPVELLVEAVMWPQRQIKEGYVATTVVTKDGRTLVGYKQKENDTELTLRDMATNALTTLPKTQIQTRTDAGSLMPDGLTASLSREELRDLIAYLAGLGK